MTMKAWHFLQDDGRLRWKCGRYWKPRVGVTLKVAPPISLCQRGLHASAKSIDALQYAPGSLVCRVKLSGEIIKDTDKMVATKRTILWKADATNVLFKLACWSAERALRLAEVTDERSWNAIRVRRAWMKGEATDQDLAAAWDAARDAALAAARAAMLDAARAAAWAAMLAAARAAARAAAWDAARDAALAAARAATWAAERKAQNRKLTTMLNELAP